MIEHHLMSQATLSHVQSLDSHDKTFSCMMSIPSPPLLVHDPIQYSHTTSYDTTPFPPIIVHTPTPSPPLLLHSTTPSPSYQKTPSSSSYVT